MGASIVLMAMPAIIIKPRFVYYSFLWTSPFSQFFAGYINQAGNLGLPLTWLPSDFLSVFVIVASFNLRKPQHFGKRTIFIALFRLIVFLNLICLIGGLLFHSRDALKAFRQLNYVSALIFASRYFTNNDKLKEFYNIIVKIILVMFVLHVFIRFNVFIPLSAEGKMYGQLLSARGEETISPSLYLVIVVLGLARFSSKNIKFRNNLILILIGVAGLLLSETRTYIGALSIIYFCAIFFFQGRLKTVLGVLLIASVLLWISSYVGFDPVYRFKAKYGRGEIVNPVQNIDEVRMMEYQSIYKSYSQKPHLIFFGRGLGAKHYLPYKSKSWIKFRTYYHSEYLGWLDKYGVVGLLALITLLIASIAYSYRVYREQSGILRITGIATFLLTCSLAGAGIFIPTFLHEGTGPIFISLIVMISNSLSKWHK